MVIKAVKAIQDLAYSVGQRGCYFIALCAIAEKITGVEVDVLKTAKFMIDQKLIDYDWARPRAYKNSMYVFDADKILELLGCGEYRINKQKELPKDYDGLYVIRHALEGNTHFTLPDYDPMTYNKVAADGRITAYYLVEKKAV